MHALPPLCEQLGYPSTRQQLEARLNRLLLSANDGVFGAEDRGTVIGWVHVQARLVLENDASVEVCSLVVLDQHRGRGIGRALMVEAENWARGKGYLDVFLRSNTARLDTHAFYEAIGYRTTKTSHLFCKTLE